MLSLKNTRFQRGTGSKSGLSDLPSEILDLILHYVYHGSGGHFTSIVPVSLTCRHVRLSAYPLLFGKLAIKANEDVIEKSSWKSLQGLISRPHLTKYVKYLEIQTALVIKELPNEADAMSARMGQTMSRKRLMGCLKLMTSLRSLKLHYISDMNFDILEQLTTLDPLQVSLDLTCSETLFDQRNCARLTQILTRSPGWVVSLSLPPSKHTSQPADVADLLASGRMGAIDWCDNSSALDILVAQNHNLRDLEELHVSSKILDVQHRLLTPGFIPWATLKRLHIEGDRQIRYLLSSAIDKMFDLQDLRLHASTTDAFHDDCINTGHRTPREPLAYTRLPNLQHLSLRGVCPHLHARHLTTPTLRTLILVLPEYHARLRSFNQARSPNEVKWIATNLPHLSHLELHVGSLENLWHPTAIPGVEVNVEVYSVLQSITRIKNLHTLRLFPPYVPRNAGHDLLNARQPLSDEQTIRVFRYLHSQCPSLHTLSIAATFHVLRGFAPMTWLVRAAGPSRSTLTTRQSQKNYELEQTWIGERRTTMFTRRHAYYRPYLRDLGAGWVFPVEDPLV